MEPGGLAQVSKKRFSMVEAPTFALISISSLGIDLVGTVGRKSSRQVCRGFNKLYGGIMNLDYPYCQSSTARLEH